MEKFVKIILVYVFLFANCVFAFGNEIEVLKQNNEIQTRIDKIGIHILNVNKIPRRVVFVYCQNEKNKTLLSQALTNRQVVVYDKIYQSAQNDDELAGFLAREIAVAIKSYSGIWGGALDSLQVAISSKKFEIVADKRAIDFMVNAGYNPLALIIAVNKTVPQKKFDKISRHNLTSKRLAIMYEYISYKYPQYLKNNEFISNPYYQNFLLTSVDNRRLLEEKMKYGSIEELKYE